jgi:hypothetical protein
MRKKGFETDLTISVLLTVPDSGSHQSLAKKYLTDFYPSYQPIFLNQAEENLPIELVRDLINQTSFARTNQEQTAYVLCGAEKASLPAQNALLKILEEPPQNILLVLVATTGHQLLPTILSRCTEVLLADKKDTTSLAEHIETMISFCHQPNNFKFYQLIDLAEQWQKDDQRNKNLIIVLNQLVANQQNSSFALNKLRQALESWKKNGNVKLVIEDCLFTIKKHYLNETSISKGN